MEEYILEIMATHNITMYQIAEGTGLAYTTVRANLKKLNGYKLDTFILVAEYLAQRIGKNTDELIYELLEKNICFKNAKRRDLLKKWIKNENKKI